MLEVPEVGCKHYGGRDHLTYQPQEGLRWKAQDKNVEHLKDTLTGNHKCLSAWIRMNLRLVL